jgi:hypothetical protein
LPSRTLPHVGDAVRLTRSGHSAGCGERGTIVAVLGKPGTEVLHVRWSEHLETFVPVGVAEVDHGELSGISS